MARKTKIEKGTEPSVTPEGSYNQGNRDGWTNIYNFWNNYSAITPLSEIQLNGLDIVTNHEIADYLLNYSIQFPEFHAAPERLPFRQNPIYCILLICAQEGYDVSQLGEALTKLWSIVQLYVQQDLAYMPEELMPVEGNSSVPSEVVTALDSVDSDEFPSAERPEDIDPNTDTDYLLSLIELIRTNFEVRLVKVNREVYWTDEYGFIEIISIFFSGDGSGEGVYIIGNQERITEQLEALLKTVEQI